MWKIIFGVLTIVSTFWGVSCSSDDGIVVDKAWVHLTPTENTPAAVYFTVTNNGTEVDTLQAVVSKQADKIEMTQTVDTAGTPVTNSVQKVEIKPGASIVFSPEGMHGAINTLKQDLIEGEEMPLELVFEKAGIINTDALIESPRATTYHKPRD